MKVLELQVKPRLVLKVEDKEYTVEYPLTAVQEAEEKLGRSLKALGDWFDIKWTEVSALLHAGLRQFHPEVTAEEIKAFCDELGAEGVLEVRHALICLNFPRAMERLEERISKGQTSPNEQSGAAH